MSKRCAFFLRAFCSLFFVALIFCFFRDNLDEVATILSETNLFLFGGIVAAWALVHVFFALRLKYIARVQGIPLGIWDAYGTVLAGLFFNNLIPSAVGGDVAKYLFLYKRTGKDKEAMSAIFFDRIVGVSTLLGIGVVSLLMHQGLFQEVRVKYTFYGMFLACLGAFVFVFHQGVARSLGSFGRFLPFQKIRRFAGEFYTCLNQYRFHPKVLLLAVIVSVVGHLFTVSLVFLLSKALSLEIPLKVFFVFFPLINFAVLAPSLNGLGAREALFVFYFSSFCPAENAIAVSILFGLVIVLVGMLGGLFVAFQGGVRLSEAEVNPYSNQKEALHAVD